MSDRVKAELELLREVWDDLEYREQDRWVLLPHYATPETCVEREVAVCFQIKPGHPGDPPYAFYVRAPIAPKGGGAFSRTTHSTDPPFAGEWIKFSWSPEGWHATADLRTGFNLRNFACSFHDRLAEGR